MKAFLLSMVLLATVGCDYDPDPCPGKLTCPNKVCCPIGYPYQCNNQCYTAPTACGSSPVTTCAAHDDGESEDCDLDVTIATTSCRFYDHPDPFSSDSWFVDVTGMAKGGASTEISISSYDSIQVTTQCASWSPYAAFTCVSKSGEAETTTWMSTVEHLHDASPITMTITAKVRGVFSSSCAEKIATKQVTCQ